MDAENSIISFRNQCFASIAAPYHADTAIIILTAAATLHRRIATPTRMNATHHILFDVALDRAICALRAARHTPPTTKEESS